VEFRPTAHFIDAVRILNQAALYLGPEGGMHHAAAALDVPAVVIFGGSPSVQATGYPDHTNFGGDEPCGRWEPCEHCAQTLNAITPEALIQAVKDHLKC
jgi:ADP-heptose:LPS heptosyltransferase